MGKEKMEKLLTLENLRTGDEGIIIKILGEGNFKKRLLEMGFIAGEKVKVEKYAPLKDPVEYMIKGYHVSLRHEEAAKILVEKV